MAAAIKFSGYGYSLITGQKYITEEMRANVTVTIAATVSVIVTVPVSVSVTASSCTTSPLSCLCPLWSCR